MKKNDKILHYEGLN
ncbi:hypothetical protein ACAY65_004373 [Escherichia coli]|nr:hypothetical protein [Escherichia coli]